MSEYTELSVNNLLIESLVKYHIANGFLLFALFTPISGVVVQNDFHTHFPNFSLRGIVQLLSSLRETGSMCPIFDPMLTSSVLLLLNMCSCWPEITSVINA